MHIVAGLSLFVLLLVAFPRQVGALLLLVGVLVVGAVLTAMETNKREVKERSSVTVEVSYSPTCGADQPIFTRIRNGSSRVMYSVRFSILGFREGYSTPVYQGSSYSTDKILQPGEYVVLCWTAPPVNPGASGTISLADAVLRAGAISPSFYSPTP